MVEAPAAALSEDEQKEADRKDVSKLIAQADTNKHVNAVANLGKKLVKKADDPELKAELAKAKAAVAADEKKASEDAAVAAAEPAPADPLASAKAEIASIEADEAKSSAIRANIMRSVDQVTG